MIKPIIKIIIAVLLLICLLDMPYGFYELIRFAAAAAFAYLSFNYFKDDRNGHGFLFAALALLFQPFFKVALGRSIWNIVDVIVAVVLILLIVGAFKNKGNKRKK
jgi:hypothetical protein